VGLIKQLIPTQTKFTPAADLNWQRIETLVSGPGATEASSIAQTGDSNSAVFACLMTICAAYPEAPLKVYKRQRNREQAKQPAHPLQRLLDMPTPLGELTVEEFWFWTAWAKHTDGNAYWRKIRSGNDTTGNVVQLWPVSPALVEPKTRKGEFISYYRVQTGPNEWEDVPTENMVHFRLGIDDKDMRRGLSPLKRLIRQISTDDEADKFTDALLKNFAIPGLVVIPAAGTLITEDTADLISTKLSRKFSSDNRGKIAVMSRESKIEQFGFSPEQLDMAILHRIPEERIAAVIGVPPIIAGLGAGLDRATYANFREAREMFTETKLVPMWRVDAARINASLLPDFVNPTARTEIFTEFDITNVRALQEDEDRKYARLNIGVQGARPWITVNEARADVGLPPVEGGDDLKQPVAAPPPSDTPAAVEDIEDAIEEEVEGEKRHPFQRTVMVAFP
jgi:HK97 family phage portal protein